MKNQRPKFRFREFHEYLSKALDLALVEIDDPNLDIYIDIDEISMHMRLAFGVVDIYDKQMKDYIKQLDSQDEKN